jgi:hypothetical protein
MSDRIHLSKVMLSGMGQPRGTYMAGMKTAVISCPECGTVGSLRDHTIKPTGEVDPSVACPNMTCSFHAHIVLDDWQPSDNGS